MWGTVPVRYLRGTGNPKAKAERSLHDLEDEMPVLQTRKSNQLTKDDSDIHTILDGSANICVPVAEASLHIFSHTRLGLAQYREEQPDYLTPTTNAIIVSQTCKLLS
jgi:hypothetical protein